MARFEVTFHKSSEPEPETYQMALAFSERIYTVVELAADVERYFLRDQLDRRSTAIPVLISQGLATAVMPDRRVIFRRARAAARDCLAVLDIISRRGTVEPEALEAARVQARVLIDRLDSLTVDPPDHRMTESAPFRVLAAGPPDGGASLYRLPSAPRCCSSEAGEPQPALV